MPAELWFDGVHLLGQFNAPRTGCWLLTNGGEAAVLQLPPAAPNERAPAEAAAEAAAALNVSVKYLLCTTAHLAHCNRATFAKLRAAFPEAVPCLHSSFRQALGDVPGGRTFDDAEKLELAGEALFLVHAPKFSQSDTVVVFRGSACVGGWELGSLRSAHDGGIWGVPKETKLRSLARVERFCQEESYNVHRVFSADARERREGVDLLALLAEMRGPRA